MPGLVYLEQFRGVFLPRNVDNLTPSAQALIGKELTWLPAWIIEEGPYQGQWALQMVDPVPAPFGWAPEEDVKRDA